MLPKPSSAAERIVSRGKICFSSHSAAWGVMASAVNCRAISWIWRCSSVRSNWLMGAPLALPARESPPPNDPAASTSAVAQIDNPKKKAATLDRGRRLFNVSPGGCGLGLRALGRAASAGRCIGVLAVADLLKFALGMLFHLAPLGAGLAGARRAQVRAEISLAIATADDLVVAVAVEGERRNRRKNSNGNQ